ncbi:unnamed protein product [Lota lota]
MSCLDVMYQVYGTPPQPYFAAAYSPYHHQKLAFYSKMQDPHDGVSRCSASSSFTSLPVPASIKEEDCGRDKEPSPEAEYLSARCVLFTYFQGDISSVVDEHFSRALSQSSSYASSSNNSKSARVCSPRNDPMLSPADGPFPMNQRSFPPSFWNSTYQSSGPSGLGAPHGELSFPGDPYSASASLHGHLHQPSPEVAWHPSHHHHHHHHHPYSLGGAIGGQSSAYPRTGVHEVYGATFDPRYGSLLVPSVRSHHHRLAASSSVPGPSGSPCDLGGKGESGAASAWSGAFAGANPDIALNVDTGLQTQDKSKDLYWF